MVGKNKTIKKTFFVEKPLFRVGDTISFAMGRTQRIRGVVVEDRGPIGGGGRRLYDIRFKMSDEYSKPQYIELPAADLQKEAESAPAEKTLAPAAA